MQIAVCVNGHRLFASQFKHRVGSLPRIQIADLPAVLSLHKNPLNIVNIRHGVLHRAHCDRETTAGKLCHRQMLLAAGFHRIGNQLFHFLPAADQRNACVMDGSDEVAAVIADVKLCLHIEILHWNVIGVFLVSI